MNDYTFKDVVFYFSLITGAALTYAALERAGVQSQLFRLIPAVLVGAGFGWICERVYVSRSKK
jgi:hypothetical protein